MPTDATGAESMTPSAFNNAASSTKSFIPPDHQMALIIAGIVLLACGSFDSLASKWQNLQYLPRCGDASDPDCSPQYFEAPFWQTFLMYIGETFCLGIYFIDHAIAKHRGKGAKLDLAGAESMNKRKSPIWWWLLPTVTDFIGSTMVNYAIVLTLASTVQLLRNFNIVITALLTIFYLRRALTIGHWIGVCIVTVGMIMTAMYAVINPTSDTNYDDSLSWLGILLALIGTILNGFQFVMEERLFRKFYMPPLKAVGTEGIFGLIIGGLALIVVQFGGWEDVKGALYQTGHSTVLIISTILYCICITGFNGCGLIVTKLGSGLLRAVLVAGRSVTVWILELCIGWNTFDVLDFFGMIVITVGVLWYNNAYPTRCCPSFGLLMRREVPCCGFVEIHNNEPLAESEERELTREEIEAAAVVDDLEKGRLDRDIDTLTSSRTSSFSHSDAVAVTVAVAREEEMR